MSAYLANGAALGVLVDPYELTLEIFRPGKDPILAREIAVVSLHPELDGFELETAALFNG